MRRIRGGRPEHRAFGLARLSVLILCLVLLVGCTPSGPRALVEGKRLIDAGHYPQAVQKLKTATALLGSTNALAWAYLGLAYQHDGKAAEAEWAYRRALDLNRDLSEVRFNLGCLRLAQNKLEAAKADFTAYTLRRRNAAEGFVKLGTAQLRSRELSAAEQSFSEALRLRPQDPEALNGLGLARLQRGRASEAAQCFESALKQDPDYRPALLNLAIVAHQYLKDRPLALQKYRDYLAVKPTPADAEALAATVRQLELELNPPARYPPTNAVGQLNTKATSAKPLAAAPPKPPATNVTRLASAPKPESAVVAAKPPVTNTPKPEGAATVLKPVGTNAPKPAATNVPKPPPPAGPPTAVVDAPKPPAESVPQREPDLPKASAAEPLISTSSVPVSAAGPKTAKRGFLERVNPLNLFRSAEKTPVQPTPLSAPARPASGEPAKTAGSGAELAVIPPPTPVPKGPSGRYAYRSPASPTPGDRPEAERSFALGVRAQQAHRLAEAIQAYRAAVRQDPSLFEAHYNLGLVATEAGNLSLALASYENALAIQPRSLDARYNLALVLKEANCLADAVNELEKVLVSYPNETRAHLALGNLYAQQFGQPAKARQHYLKVIELEPRHPQAGPIRYWLAANPP